MVPPSGQAEVTLSTAAALLSGCPIITPDWAAAVLARRSPAEPIPEVHAYSPTTLQLTHGGHRCGRVTKAPNVTKRDHAGLGHRA